MTGFYWTAFWVTCIHEAPRYFCKQKELKKKKIEWWVVDCLLYL